MVRGMRTLKNVAKVSQVGVSPERIQALISHIAQKMPILQEAETEDAAIAAIADLVGGIGDLLSVPAFATALTMGMKIAARETLATAKEAGTLNQKHLSLLRQAVGVTQKELADHLILDRVAVARWESGADPLPAKHIPTIIDYLTTMAAH
jgi:DNA-binding transcriptional regulator YiaG